LSLAQHVFSFDSVSIYTHTIFRHLLPLHPVARDLTHPYTTNFLPISHYILLTYFLFTCSFVVALVFIYLGMVSVISITSISSQHRYGTGTGSDR
jgi:hypothetical protein